MSAPGGHRRARRRSRHGRRRRVSRRRPVASAPVRRTSAPRMPSSVAMARAVAGWSPVISTGVIPAAWQEAMVAAADAGAGPGWRPGRAAASPVPVVRRGRRAGRPRPRPVPGTLPGEFSALGPGHGAGLARIAGRAGSRGLPCRSPARLRRAAVHGGHPLAAAVERDLADPRHAGGELLRVQAEPDGGGQQRCLGGVADRRPVRLSAGGCSAASLHSAAAVSSSARPGSAAASSTWPSRRTWPSGP